MATINNYVKTEGFLVDRLLGAKLDSFRVYSIELQLNFLGDTSEGLQSYWLSAMGNVSLTDRSNTFQDRPEVLANPYGLMGQNIKAVNIKDNGALELCVGNKVLTICIDDEAFEVVWSVTPESPDPYVEHDWSVTLTDESELVMT